MPRLLIADDDDVLRDLLGMDLSKEFEVIEARNGKEAVEKYVELKPDVVLMDIVMPEMDGVQATKEILKIDPMLEL